MLRQGSSRSPPTRGLRAKDALYISLVLAITIWLLYHLIIHHENTFHIGMGEFETKQIELNNKNIHEENVMISKIHDASQEKEKKDEMTEMDMRKEHENREKSFKADDVSSSVPHDPQILANNTKSLIGFTKELSKEDMNNNKKPLIQELVFDFELRNDNSSLADSEKNITISGDKNEIMINLNQISMGDSLVEDARDHSEEGKIGSSFTSIEDETRPFGTRKMK